jgi:hypothetical protein
MLGGLLGLMATGTLRVVLLWHMHQPLYKDLVTGEYRLPWVRMHALKDYYGMVKLLDEFPNVHQNFQPRPVARHANSGVRTRASPRSLSTTWSPSPPAKELTPDDKRFALQYLFQAQPGPMIGRYPATGLVGPVRSVGPDPPKPPRNIFSVSDYTDLQVLSQIAWFDEFFPQEPEVKATGRQGRRLHSRTRSRVRNGAAEILNACCPPTQAAKRGLIEIERLPPFYHPILPLVCDTNMGAVSSPGLAAAAGAIPPSRRRATSRSAATECGRMKKVFGVRPKGMWPSEGSVSEEVQDWPASNGLEWMATDEEVLGRSSGNFFRTRRPGPPLGRAGGAALQHLSLRTGKHADEPDLPRPHGSRT